MAQGQWYNHIWHMVNGITIYGTGYRVTYGIFHYFERSSEELALLDKYGISLNESIGSATNKVILH